MQNVVVISGPAGSGLSSAEFVFEELGYYVIKNAPGASTDTIISSLKEAEAICFVCHPRSAEETLKAIRKNKDVSLRLVVLNCDEN